MLKVKRKIKNRLIYTSRELKQYTENLKGPSFDGRLVRKEAEEAETWKQTQF